MLFNVSLRRVLLKNELTMHTFYLPAADWDKETSLPAEEARHAVHVLRMQPGEDLRLLDGQGREGIFTITRITKKQISIVLKNEIFHEPPAAKAIIALAFSKALRRGFFMEKAAELGAWQIWLWQGEHSQGRLPDKAAENARGQLIAGMKQCGNPWLPQVSAFTGGIADIVSRAADADFRLLPWEQQHDVPMLTMDKLGLPGTTIYVIGPEGGFSERELSALHEARFSPVSLGQRILRCETAATLSLGLHWWASHR